MKNEIFNYLNYKKYMNEKIYSMPSEGRGERLKISKALKCQPTYISQVLNGSYNFSLEQGEKINALWNHSQLEGHFFLLLISHYRAATPGLKKYYKQQIDQVTLKRRDITNRLQISIELTEEDKYIYYSTWYYAAIHVLITIPEFRTKGAIINYLKLPATIVAECLEFLTRVGLVKLKGDYYVPGKIHMHLPGDALQIKAHHNNWRSQAINSINMSNSDDLHYSVVVSISKNDINKIKDRILSNIDEIMKIVGPSKEETLQAITFDFFSLNNSD